MPATLPTPQPRYRPASASLLKRLVIEHPLVAFFILAYVGAWIVLLLPVLSQSGLGLLPFASPVPTLLFFIPAAIAGPTLAAFVVTRMVEGKDGTRDLRRRILGWRVGPHWYLIALFGLPLAYFVAASLVFGAAPLNTLIEKWPLVFTSYLPNVVVLIVLVSVWEEIGWTGFALPRLQERYGPLLASVILGVLWALWHLPAYFVSGQVVDHKVGFGDLDRLLYLLPLLVLMAIPSRVVMTWLYNNAVAAGVIIITLFHAGWDMTNSNIVPTFMPEVNERFQHNELIYAIFGVLALLLIALMRGRLSYKAGERASPQPGAPAPPTEQERGRVSTQ
jgi:membrane protease YdiL (CAAX protease family)